MKTVIFILGGKTDDEVPRERFRLRLEWAVNYYQQHHGNEDITFLVSGRFGNVNENAPITEAEVGKRYISERIPDASIIKEDVSVDTIGNFAFSKPLIAACHPDTVVIVTSELFRDRIDYLAQKIFHNSFSYIFQPIQDELADDEILIQKEKSALSLLKKLVKDVKDGDDALVREMLLYKTPYYFKGVIDDKTFFDEYWEGGFEHFLNGLSARNSK